MSFLNLRQRELVCIPISHKFGAREKRSFQFPRTPKNRSETFLEPAADIHAPYAHIREPLPDIRQSRADLGTAYANFRPARADLRQPLADIRQPLADFRQPFRDAPDAKCMIQNRGGHGLTSWMGFHRSCRVRLFSSSPKYSQTG